MSATNAYPVVLACGIARFDRVPGWRRLAAHVGEGMHYYKRIRAALNEAGFSAHHTLVDWAGPVEKRAKDLGGEVDSVLALTGRTKVHIIAHSMGGLDARWMIAKLGYAESEQPHDHRNAPSRDAGCGLVRDQPEAVAMVDRPTLTDGTRRHRFVRPHHSGRGGTE